VYADYNEVKKVLTKFPKYLKILGKSVWGKNIYALVKGKGGIIVQAGMHAREHVTTKVLLYLLQYRAILSEFRDIAIIPLVNPDGVDLCLHGATAFKNAEWLRFVNGSDDFSKWKANANAVDINVNFDALWGQGKSNVDYPSPTGYVGKTPDSEPETKTLVDFTREYRAKYSVSLHAKGEEIYSGFLGIDKDPALSKKFASAVGYPLKETSGSVGGYKDWCVFKLGISGYTVEIGNDKKSYLELYDDVKEIAERVYEGLLVLRDYER